MKPKLYQFSACPFCCKIRALLDYKGIAYETIEVNPMNKNEIRFSKEYKKVPIFVDEQGIQVNDSPKIMRYIERFYPEKAVFEKDSKRSTLESLWFTWADEKLAKALPPLIYETFPAAYKAFSYISKVGKFSFFQKIGIRFSGALVMNIVAKRLAKKQMISNPKENVTSLLKEWGDALHQSNFLGLDHPNGADFAIFGVLNSIESLPSFDIVKQNKRVYLWYQSVKQAIYPQKVRL